MIPPRALDDQPMKQAIAEKELIATVVDN